MKLRMALGVGIGILCLGLVYMQVALADPPQRSISITSASCSCSGGNHTLDGAGSLGGQPGDTYKSGSLQLKWDGGAVSTPNTSVVQDDPLVAQWSWSAGSASLSGCPSGNHKVGAKAVLVDTQNTEHQVDVPVANEQAVTCS
jgi:hypothetical protein